MPKKICENCKKEFISNDKRRKCCGWVCRNIRISKMYKGKEFTQEHKDNIKKNHHDVSGKNNPKWRGGKRPDGHGYIWVWSPDHPYKDNRGYVREHRLVMEKKIGRYLLPEEIVHHMDHNKSNNDINNLMLYESKSAHVKHHYQSGDYGIKNAPKKS